MTFHKGSLRAWLSAMPENWEQGFLAAVSGEAVFRGTCVGRDELALVGVYFVPVAYMLQVDRMLAILENEMAVARRSGQAALEVGG